MFKHCLSALTLLTALAVTAPHLQAQAVATATGNALSVGLVFQNADPDYGPSRSSGLGAYLNFDFARYLGLTAEVNAPTAFSKVIYPERTYMFGGRGIYRRGRYGIFVKVLGGVASAGNNSSVYSAITPAQLINANQSFGVLAGGGGLEYRLDRPLTLRLDYESQHWLGYEPNSLTPGIFSIGAAYRFQ